MMEKLSIVDEELGKFSKMIPRTMNDTG